MLTTLSPSPDRLTPPGPPQVSSECLRLPQAVEPSVLVVDDDPDIPPLVDTALSPFHTRVDSVSSGKEALERMRQQTYDLIVLDLVMDDIHGLDILRYLRTHSRFDHTKVLILTADVSHEALARCFGHGADDFVRKPFDLHELALRAFRLICPFQG